MAKENTKATVQKVGRSLSAMVMPNIGAFVAWGLITALFIDTGWLPNAKLSSMVSPMLTYLLPLLVGYTAGNNIAGRRGAVIAVIASMGVIVGSSITQFLGVMIYAPLAAWIISKFDKAIDGKVKAGFEMLVDNFSVGIMAPSSLSSATSLSDPLFPQSPLSLPAALPGSTMQSSCP